MIEKRRYQRNIRDRVLAYFLVNLTVPSRPPNSSS
jgi:hypothetical protein